MPDPIAEQRPTVRSALVICPGCGRELVVMVGEVDTATNPTGAFFPAHYDADISKREWCTASEQSVPMERL